MSLNRAIIEQVNRNNKIFVLERYSLTNGGYEGYQFIFKEDIGQEAYMLAVNLISSKVVYEVEIIDCEKYRTHIFKRDYDTGLGALTNIHTIQDDSYFYIEGGINITVKTLDIEKEQLLKIHKLVQSKTFNKTLKVLSHIFNLIVISRPEPVINNESPTEEELIELINFNALEFKIQRHVNLDGFFDGYIIEGISNLRSSTIPMIKQMDYVEYIQFPEVEKKQLVTITGDSDYHCSEEGFNDYIESSFLKVNDSHLSIKAYLSHEDLQEMSKLKLFKELLGYLHKKIQLGSNIQEKFDLEDESDILPF